MNNGENHENKKEYNTIINNKKIIMNILVPVEEITL